MDEYKSMNIAVHLQRIAAEHPHLISVVAQSKLDDTGRASYTHLTAKQLCNESDYLANGLESIGITKGTKTVLMVPPSPTFFIIVFAMFKIGAIPVIIDPGVGVRKLGKSMEQVSPEAFIGISKAHAARVLMGWAKKSIKTCVTVGKRWFWGGYRLRELRKLGYHTGGYEPITPTPNQIAAILFTSGSTGPSKGVVYTHEIFNAQIEYLKKIYNITPGEIDLSTFPLFALFGPALGMTSIIPDMDTSHPITANPEKLIVAIEDFGATNMFGSPAIINKLGTYGKHENIFLPSLKRVISAGAPARIEYLQKFSSMIGEDVNIYTPYGATEALPVCNMGSRELLKMAENESMVGKGICIGKPVSGLTMKVIRITDNPITTWRDDLELPDGEIGELVVKGPIVTSEYYNNEGYTALAKIYEGTEFYHRMGDVGYKDKNGNFWFCGRKSHRVRTELETLFTLPCESIFNTHKAVFRTALVGIPDPEANEKLQAMQADTMVLDQSLIMHRGKKGHRGKMESKVVFKKPVICVELADKSVNTAELIEELKELAKSHEMTESISQFLIHPSFPMDPRHNAKIFREKLAIWAEKKLK